MRELRPSAREQVRRVALEQFDSVCHSVRDSLTRRLPTGPEFEVLETVVQPIAVSVMNRFVWPQRAVELRGHYEPMLRACRRSAAEASKVRRHRHVPVAVVNEAGSGDLADRLVCLHIAVLAFAIRVRVTQAACNGVTFTTVDGARGVHPPFQWAIRLNVAGPEQSKVMTVAKTALGRCLLAGCN